MVGKSRKQKSFNLGFYCKRCKNWSECGCDRVCQWCSLLPGREGSE